MKNFIASAILLLFFQDFVALGFTSLPQSLSPWSVVSSSQHFMFGGAGAAGVEDDPEQEKAIAQGAAAMNMSVEEYKLAMRAREQLVQTMDGKIVKSGNADTIMIERDVNNPPKTFEITITDKGKDLGRAALSKELVNLLEKCNVEAVKGRQEAQQEMMTWVQSQAS